MSNNVPKLRFKEFNDEWEVKQLSDLLYESKLKNKCMKFGKEDVLSVSGEFGIVNQIEHMGRSYAGVSVDNYGVVKKGDIVYTKSPLKSNPYGIIKTNKGVDGIVSTLYAIYSCKESVSNLFIDYYFQLDDNTNKYVRPLVHKGAKNDMKINNEYFLSGSITIPQLKEQEKISNFLTKVDKIVEKQEEKVNNVEIYKKGMMQNIFSQKIRFKYDDGSNYPQWEEKKLGEIVALVKDGTHGTHTDVDNGPYLLSAKNIKDGRIVITKDDRKISYEDFNLIYKNYSLKKDDILLSIVGTIGRTAIVKDEKDIVFQRSVAILRFDNNYVNYIYQFMNTREFQDSLIKNQVVSAQPGIYLNDLKRLNFKIPCLEEQIKIARLLSNIDLILEKEKEKLEELRLWKKGLLQQMFV